MSFSIDLQVALEAEETRTVSDVFGGIKCDGKTQSFDVDSVSVVLTGLCITYPTDPVALSILQLQKDLLKKEFQFVVGSLIRFSFLIELTNLNISSTKMKTRWVLCKIIRTKDGGFNNYQADFKPGFDPRAATFDECFEIFKESLRVLLISPRHLVVAKALTSPRNRSVSYESLLTYVDSKCEPVHVASNVRLVNLNDISWLIKNRVIIRKVLTTANVNKMKTKTYKTDRSQVGADQTNRAKRWEVLSADYQHATIEECWSVERELLAQLLNFKNFPQHVINQVSGTGHVVNLHRCPVTHEDFDFLSFTNPSAHGSSPFQVGHLVPLRISGRHVASNVAWVTEDGNRIQGNLTLVQVRELLGDIYKRGAALGIYP
jgi:hypothetical protein